MKQIKVLIITCTCGFKKYLKYKEKSPYSVTRDFCCFYCLKHISGLRDEVRLIDSSSFYKFLDINEQYIDPDSIKNETNKNIINNL